MGGLSSKLGEPQRRLGGPQNKLGGPWSQLGVLQSQLGGPWSQLGGPLSQLGGSRNQLGGPCSPPGGPWRQLGGPQSLLEALRGGQTGGNEKNNRDIRPLWAAVQKHPCFSTPIGSAPRDCPWGPEPLRHEFPPAYGFIAFCSYTKFPFSISKNMDFRA